MESRKAPCWDLFFTPVEDVIKAHGLDCMMYADDSQLYIVINPRSDRLKKSVTGWYTRSFHQSLTRTNQSFMAYQLLNLINYSAFRMPQLDSSLELLNLII